jgi:hypothetical protein
VIVAVTGGRKFQDGATLWRALSEVHDTEGITMLVLGGATGADESARKWATAKQVPHLVIPAAWDKLGKAAGTARNGWMLLPTTVGLPPYKVDLLIYVTGGRGTADAVLQARELGVRTWTPYPELDNWPEAS